MGADVTAPCRSPRTVNPACGRAQQARHQPQQGGLARAVGPDQTRSPARARRAGPNSSMAGARCRRNALVTASTRAKGSPAMAQSRESRSSVTVTGMPCRRPLSGLSTSTRKPIDEVRPQLACLDGLGRKLRGRRDKADLALIRLCRDANRGDRRPPCLDECAPGPVR